MSQNSVIISTATCATCHCYILICSWHNLRILPRICWFSVAHYLAYTFIMEPVPAVDLRSADLDWFLSRRPIFFWANAATFVVSLFLLIGGRLVADFERWLSVRFSGSLKTYPSRLEVLTLELLGLIGVLATSIFHAIYLRG